MHYIEALPDNIFTNHIESYWQIKTVNSDTQEIELLLPTCTFNIIFSERPCLVKSKANVHWKHLKPGGTFFGQTNSSIIIKSKHPINLLGIRFKPFAFSKKIQQPAYLLNDDFIALKEWFPLKSQMVSLIEKINMKDDHETLFKRFDELMFIFFKDSLTVDEKLRAQLNFIMDRKGAMKISELFSEFGVSKVTLRNHFINKVGLTPKKVSQIWRMNYVLQLKAENPQLSLTEMSLQAGFYDQAHFIKDFKQIFSLTPRKFFNEKPEIFKLAHHNISRRFSNQYDPK